MEIKLTVFTTTYNRGFIIQRLYSSLCNQTYMDFEWIIVNDGSTDNTDELVQAFIIEKKIKNIRYVKNPSNGGVAASINQGILLSKGKLFFKVDDDDYLREDALELILKYESTILKGNQFAGVGGLRCYSTGQAIGHEWVYANDFIDANNFERKKMKLDGDKAEAYYIEVLNKYGPLPYIDGETYAFEGILWNRIANANLKIRWFNEKIYITDYLLEGETSNYFKNCKKNFKAYSLYVNEIKGYTKISFIDKFICVSKYFAVSFFKKLKRGNLPKEFEWNKKWLKYSYACGWLIYFLRKYLKGKKYNIE